MPTEYAFTVRFVSRIRRRIRAVLFISVSTKPSRLPRRTLSLSGSLVLLCGYVRVSSRITSVKSSIISAEIPLKTFVHIFLRSEVTSTST